MNRLITLFILLAGLSLPVSGNTLPEYYPPTFTKWGTLQNLNIQNGTAVIGDQGFRLSARLQVYTGSSRYGTAHNLRNGMTVGITASTQQRNQLIREMWVLPKDYKPAL